MLGGWQLGSIPSVPTINILMNKLLITSGCSFSTMFNNDDLTWPSHLERQLKGWNSKHYGMGSQGNGLISRSVIYGVSNALKKYSADDILVGIMWSGTGRHDYFVDDTDFLSFKKDKNNVDGWLQNPTGFIPSDTKNWVILNAGWKLPEAKLHYENFYDPVGSIIYTLEHVLRTQWFLQSYKIKYFMTCYTDYVLHKNIELSNNHVKHLYDLIDFNNFLPVTSITTWLLDNKIEPLLALDEHPSRAQHKAFTDKVIMPFLLSKNYI